MQKSVNLYPAIGVPGQEVAAKSAVYTPQNFISDGTAAAGSFVFAAEAEGKGVAFPVASAKGEGECLGLCERVFSGVLAFDENGTMVYPKGHALTIATRGDYYVSATGVAQVGQAVLCDPATGEVTYGNAGDQNDTGWKVVTEAKGADDIIIISNRG